MSPHDIAELRRLLTMATPGPWYLTGAPWFTSVYGVLAGSPDGNVGYLIADCDDWGGPRDEYDGPAKLADKAADAALIVAAVNALPALLDRVKRLEAASQKAAELIDKLSTDDVEIALDIQGVRQAIRDALSTVGEDA